MDVETYYFGCRTGEIGHYLHRRGMSHCREQHMKWAQHLDGVFPPATTGYEVEGEAAMHFVHGFTVIAFWDRSQDKRHASNSAFYIKGQHDFESAVRLAREAFPSVWERFKFEVVLSAEYEAQQV